MALNYEADTAGRALPVILSDLLEYADEVGSRNGRVKEILNAQIVLHEPWRREILTVGRGANIFAQIAETCWVLAGRNDIEWLSAYLPRARDYSDDGETWRGGYGPRIRAWGGYPHQDHAGAIGKDQLRYVVTALKNDSLSRRAVIAIYDPTVDMKPGKDIPCNDFLQFQNRNGLLYLTVTVRSNDAMWGWSGINAFEWSALQEIVATLLGVGVGPLTFNIGSLHLYEPHWEKARKIVRLMHAYSEEWNKQIRFSPNGAISELEEVDGLLTTFFEWEKRCRVGDVNPRVFDFHEPLFRAWMAAIAYYWTRDLHWLEVFQGTPLAVAVQRTPVSLLPEPVSASAGAGGYTSNPYGLSEPHRAFYDFVCQLHADKHASYGDSWKKRGEKLSILANIARKVDRLGVADRFESESDTWIDLWVYLAKYLCWLNDVDQGPEQVNPTLLSALRNAVEIKDHVGDTRDLTTVLDNYMEEVDGASLQDKKFFVEYMLRRIAGRARDIWLAENEYKGADVD